MPLLRPLYADIDTSASASAFPLPVGTQIGDTLVMWGLASTFTVSDTRFTWHLPHSSSTETGGFWIGKATTLDPVAASAVSGSGVRSVNIRVMTFRDRVLTRRINSVNAGTANKHTVPVVSGSGSGAILLALAWAGVGGCGILTVSGADSWTNETTNNNYDGAGHGWTTACPLSGTTVSVSWSNNASPISYASVLLLTGGSYDAPPCRNIKRGDRLDLGGARNYPPSKMQQTSSRGVGAY